MAPLPQPSPEVGMALASAVVHAQELTEPGGHDFDAAAFEGALAVPGVREYMDELRSMALLPVKR